MKPMKKIDTYIYKLGLWAGAALSLTACVDEDLSDCPPNVEMREITVSYQIDLQHGVDPEFEAELLSLHLGFWNSPQNLYRDLVSHLPGHRQGFGLSAFLRCAEHADGGRKDGTLHRIDEPGGGQGETSREPPRDDEKHQMLSLPHATRILVLGGRLHQQRPAEDGRIGLQSDRGGAAHRV